MKVLSLIKKDFIIDYGFILNPSAALRDKNNRNKLLLFPLIVLMILFYTYIFVKFIFGSLPDEVIKHIGGVLLTIGYVVFFMITLMTSIAPFISKTYFSNDVSILQRLPVKSSDIFISKVVGLSVNSLFFGVIVLLPIVYRYGVANNSGVIYYSVAFINAMAGTMIVSSVMALLVSIVMRYINGLPRVKNIMQFINMFVVIAIVVGIQVYSRRLAGIETLDFIQSNQGIINTLTILLPFVRLIERALTTSKISTMILNTASVIAISGISVFISAALGSGFLMRGVSANQVVAKKKNTTIKESGYQKTSVAVSLAKREISEIFRTPVYAFNILSIGILMPIFIALPLINEGNAIGEIANVSVIIKELNISGINQIGIPMIIGLFVSIFLAMSGQSAITSITREGKRIWMMQSLPIHPKDQINGRMIASIFFGIIAVAPVTIIIIFLFKPSILMILGFIIGALAGVYATSSFGLLLGILYPKLVWDNPQQAIKQNFTVFISMILTWIYIGILGFITYKLFTSGIIKLDNAAFVGIVLTAVHIIMGYLVYRKQPSIFEEKLPDYRN